MGELYRSDICDIDINKSLLRSHVGLVLATGDKLANRFGVNVYRAGEAVDITGCAVNGYFLKANGDTIVISGTAKGNKAYVDLPQACYASDGSFSLAIKISGGSVTNTVRIVDGCIRLTQTDALIDPGEAVPTLDDIFVKIAAMEQATAKANQATATANTAAANADAKALELTQEVNAVITDIAPAIVSTAKGSMIIVADSTDRPVKGLRLYGKTTQSGTPAPSSPVAMVSAGDDGNIKQVVAGKNLLNTSKITFFDGLPSASKGISIPFTIAAGQYTVFTKTNTGTKRQNVLAVALYDASEKVIVQCNNSTSNAINAVSRFTVTQEQAEKIAIVNVYYNAANDADRADGEHITEIQIEAGSVATAYEPYNGQSITVSTPDGIHGIPVSTGGNYTDENGQQWITDEVDFGRGVYVQRIVQKRMQNLLLYSTGSAGLTIGYDSTLNNTFVSGVGMSNALPLFTTDQQWLSNQGCFAAHRSRGPLVQIAGCTTLDALNAYLAANEVIVQVALQTPVETALSAAEQEAFAALRTKYGNTTAYNDACAGMQLDYVADTKLYIDQKITAIATALVNA